MKQADMTVDEVMAWRATARKKLRVLAQAGKLFGVYGRMIYLLYAFARGTAHARVERRLTEHSLHPEGNTIAGGMLFAAMRAGLVEKSDRRLPLAGWVDVGEDRVKRFGPRTPRPRPLPGTGRRRGTEPVTAEESEAAAAGAAAATVRSEEGAG
jgi:hypothetical protein